MLCLLTASESWSALPQPDRASGRAAMAAVIDALQQDVPAVLVELRRLGRTLTSEPATCWPASTGPAPATAPPRPRPGSLSTSAAPLWGFATSPTTSPDPSSRPAASGPGYTLDCDEPHCDGINRDRSGGPVRSRRPASAPRSDPVGCRRASRAGGVPGWWGSGRARARRGPNHRTG